MCVCDAVLGLNVCPCPFLEKWFVYVCCGSRNAHRVWAASIGKSCMCVLDDGDVADRKMCVYVCVCVWFCCMDFLTYFVKWLSSVYVFAHVSLDCSNIVCVCVCVCVCLCICDGILQSVVVQSLVSSECVWGWGRKICEYAFMCLRVSDKRLTYRKYILQMHF